MKSKLFQSLLQNYFLENLIKQRNVSPQTINSYRDTFRIFLKFKLEESNCKSTNITIEELNAETIIRFLKYLENVRHNSNTTINNRLAAIHSFMNYVSYQNPEYLSIIKRVMNIPFKKTDQKNITYLLVEEVEAIIQACTTTTLIGRRDQLMVLLLYNTGVRVSELISIKSKDITLNNNMITSITIMGKGRKERTIPLWKNTKICLTNFLNETSKKNEQYLFTSSNGKPLSRSGIAYRLKIIVEKASIQTKSLSNKKITPHIFRHTTAMHLLEAGVDISTIAIWLGHESIETTHKYMVSNLHLKEQALANITEPEISKYRYKANDEILSFLDSL